MFKKFLNDQYRKMNEAEAGDAGSPPVQSSYSEEMDGILADVGVDMETSGEIGGLEIEDNGNADDLGYEYEDSDDDLGDIVKAGEKTTPAKNRGENKETKEESLIEKFLSENEADDGQSDAENKFTGEESEESEGNEEEWLKGVDSLDLKHDGKAFDVQSREHAKELLQKGYDYTQKTQLLSEDKKTFEGEKDAFITELKEREASFNKQFDEVQEELDNGQIFNEVLNDLKREDPDFYDELQVKFQAKHSQRNNPAFKNQMERMNERFSELEKETQKVKSEYALKEFDRDLTANGNLISDFKNSLGLTVDQDAVKERWMQGDSVKQAIYSVHGEQIQKLLASKNKVAKTRQSATKRRPVISKGNARGSRTVEKKIDWKNNSYQSLVGQIGDLL